MDADGTNRVRLAAGSLPVWSPDGSRIAFVSADGVTVMNADGSDARALTAGVDPTWSPDGARLAVSRVRCVADICGSDLFVVNADGPACANSSRARPSTPRTTPPGHPMAPSSRSPGAAASWVGRRTGSTPSGRTATSSPGPGCCTGARASEDRSGLPTVNDRLRGGARESQHRGHDHFRRGRGAQPARGQPGNGYADLVEVATRRGTVGIYLMNADGSAVRQPGMNPFDRWQDQLSPDGT